VCESDVGLPLGGMTDKDVPACWDISGSIQRDITCHVMLATALSDLGAIFRQVLSLSDRRVFEHANTQVSLVAFEARAAALIAVPRAEGCLLWDSVGARAQVNVARRALFCVVRDEVVSEGARFAFRKPRARTSAVGRRKPVGADAFPRLLEEPVLQSHVQVRSTFDAKFVEVLRA